MTNSNIRLTKFNTAQMCLRYPCSFSQTILC